MTERQTDADTRRSLEQLRAQLIERDADAFPIRVENQDDDYGSGHHSGDDATELFMQERNLALQGATEEQIAEIDLALQRLDEGAYGLCIECGQPIAPERLAARPYAVRCVTCQARREQSRA